MKNKNDRLLFILKWIYNPRKKRTTIHSLLEGLQEDGMYFSKRTLERDVQYLKERNLICFCDKQQAYDRDSYTDLK